MVAEDTSPEMAQYHTLAEERLSQQGQPPSPITVQQVSAGLFHTCALLSDGTLKCWGYNESGELGDGHNVDSTIPVNVFGVNNSELTPYRPEARYQAALRPLAILTLTLCST